MQNQNYFLLLEADNLQFNLSLFFKYAKLIDVTSEKFLQDLHEIPKQQNFLFAYLFAYQFAYSSRSKHQYGTILFLLNLITNANNTFKTFKLLTMQQ